MATEKIHWSPTEIERYRQQLKDWYQRHRRHLPWRESANPYAIWVSEVMLQQTQVKTVIPYFERWMSAFPDIAVLAQADLQVVLKAWEGLGYYARARNFHRAARLVVNDHNGKIPDDYKTFRKLPGVGPYIAAAVQSIAFGGAYAVVDGNVKRVLARLFLLENPANDAGEYRHFATIADALLARDNPGDYNQALMEIGALICRPKNPLCQECPLASLCAAAENGRQDQYPRRISRAKIPEQQQVMVIIHDPNNRMLIIQRPEDRLLGGLWEFPADYFYSGEPLQKACKRIAAEKVNLKIKSIRHLGTVKHAYTHFKVVVDVFSCQSPSATEAVLMATPAPYKWVTREELNQFPRPKTNIKAFELLDSL